MSLEGRIWGKLTVVERVYQRLTMTIRYQAGYHRYRQVNRDRICQEDILGRGGDIVDLN